jgi:Ni,Fe-hydrogenase maturation factor
MAESVACSDIVVIVDAIRRESPAVSMERLSAGPSRPTGHAIDAPGLLSLAKQLYGAEPITWRVAVAAPEMPHREQLSETAETASLEAASVVLRLLTPDR